MTPKFCKRDLISMDFIEGSLSEIIKFGVPYREKYLVNPFFISLIFRDLMDMIVAKRENLSKKERNILGLLMNTSI